MPFFLVPFLVFSFWSITSWSFESSEAIAPRPPEDILNYGTLKITDGLEVDEEIETVDQQENQDSTISPTLAACKSRWGVPDIDNDCDDPKVVKLDVTNELPTGWYRLHLGEQEVPIFIFPEGNNANLLADFPPMALEPKTVDQIIEIAKLSDGVNHRTSLTYQYRVDYSDPGHMFAAALVELQGNDSPFHPQEEALDKALCQNPITELNDYQDPVFHQHRMVCEALHSPDPTNLITDVVRADDDGQLLSLDWIDAKFTWSPVKTLNDYAIRHTTKSWAPALPGRYRLRYENADLEAEPVLRGDEVVVAGESLWSQFAQKSRLWKAVLLPESDSFLLLNLTNDQIEFRQCPNTNISMIGATTPSPEPSRLADCQLINGINAQTQNDFFNSLTLLEQQEAGKIDLLREQISQIGQTIDQTNQQIAEKENEKAASEEQIQQLNEELADNLYAVTKKREQILQEEKQAQIAEKKKVEREMFEWLNEVLDILDNDSNIAKPIGIGGTIVFLLALIILFVLGPAATALAVTAMKTIMIVAALAAIGGIFGSAYVDKVNQFLGEFVDEIQYCADNISDCALKTIDKFEANKCEPNTRVCRQNHQKILELIKRWAQADKRIAEINLELTEIEELKGTEEYSIAKDRYLLITKVEIPALKVKIAQIEKDITQLIARLESLEQEKQVATAELKSTIFTAAKIFGFNQSLGRQLEDPGLRWIRQLNLTWEEVESYLLQSFQLLNSSQ